MKLTNPERLMLLMLAEIHEKVGVRNGVDTKLLASAIHNDQTWALTWEMPGIVGDQGEATPREVTKVVDILDMGTFIEEAYDKLGPSEKAQLEKDADPFGKDVEFRGFDANNEKEYGIAKFLVDDMGRFARFKGHRLNSYSPSIDMHNRMLAVFEPIQKTLDGRSLSVAELAQILNAKRHPSA